MSTYRFYCELTISNFSSFSLLFPQQPAIPFSFFLKKKFLDEDLEFCIGLLGKFNKLIYSL
jgi:hypothetical protein